MTTSVEKVKYTSPEGSKTWEYLAILICACIAGCFGFVIGWNSPSFVILMADDSPIRVTESDISTLAAISAVGQLVAPPLNIFLADGFGRKNTMLLTFLPFLANWALIAVASTIWCSVSLVLTTYFVPMHSSQGISMSSVKTTTPYISEMKEGELYVARFLAGFGVGLLICIEPMYVGEISSTKTRGVADSITVIVYNAGILITFVVAPQISLSAMALIFFVYNFSCMIAFWFMPESPYFLVRKNRMDEAEEALEKLRGKADVSDELQLVIACVSQNEKGVAKSVTVKDIFSSRGHIRAIVIILLFSVTHHFGGFFAIITYCQLIFKSTNNIVSDYTTGIIIGATQVISAVVTAFLVDKLGRKPLILVSGIIAALCNLVIGSFFYAKEHTSIDVQMYSLVPFIASMVLVFTFSCGLVALQATLMTEIFATEIKAVGMCLMAVISGLEAIAGFKLYIWLAITLGYGHSIPFLGYFVVVAVCTAIIYRITPETKGKTFLEIQRKLNGTY